MFIRTKISLLQAVAGVALGIAALAPARRRRA